MYGLKKDSYRMRCKSPAMTQGPRPADSTHGVCPVCSVFHEELHPDGRCHTEECEALLVKKCIERGAGFSTTENGHTFTFIKPDGIVSKGQAQIEQFDALHEEETIDAHMCGCGRALKMPRADVCTSCYREANVAKMQARKVERARKAKRRKDKRVSNRIKGLEHIKLK